MSQIKIRVIGCGILNYSEQFSIHSKLYRVKQFGQFIMLALMRKVKVSFLIIGLMYVLKPIVNDQTSFICGN